MIELLESQTPDAVIKVVGVGGCGGNAVDHMINNGVQGVEFISMNTDAQALKRNLAKTTLQLGTRSTKGLGAGRNPEVGRLAAEEDRERITELDHRARTCSSSPPAWAAARARARRPWWPRSRARWASSRSPW
jgi:cell division GTPase FtsZ